MLRAITLLIVFLVTVMFCFANLQIVGLRTIFGEEVRSSLAFLLLGAFAAGFAAATLLGVHQALRRRLRDRARFRSFEDNMVVLPAPPELSTEPRVNRNALARRWR